MRGTGQLLRSGRPLLLGLLRGNRNFQSFQENAGYVPRSKEKIMIVGRDRYFLDGDHRRSGSLRSAREGDTFQHATRMRKVCSLKAPNGNFAGPILRNGFQHVLLGERPVKRQDNSGNRQHGENRQDKQDQPARRFCRPRGCGLILYRLLCRHCHTHRSMPRRGLAAGQANQV